MKTIEVFFRLAKKKHGNFVWPEEEVFTVEQSCN
jgi:hypothetical protein